MSSSTWSNRLFRFGEFDYDWIVAGCLTEAILFYQSLRDDWEDYVQLYLQSGNSYSEFLETFVVEEPVGFFICTGDDFKVFTGEEEPQLFYSNRKVSCQ